MNFIKEKNCIIIKDKENFNPEHILECGQVFSYRKEGENYIVFPEDKYAEIIDEKDYFKIITNDVDYFINYFDLNRDYSLIKNKLSDFKLLKEPIKFGSGIRILNQNLFETLISFIISANNNIKRITLILNNLRKKLGFFVKNDVFSFPSYEKLKNMDEEFFAKMGAGYRAKYLVKVLKQVNPQVLGEKKNLQTKELRDYLISLSGVGPKIADCVLLFGYKRGDVFPVDTWIHQMYNQYYSNENNRGIIRDKLTGEFGALSGYAQQYLFYYQRNFSKNR